MEKFEQEATKATHGFAAESAAASAQSPSSDQSISRLSMGPLAWLVSIIGVSLTSVALAAIASTTVSSVGSSTNAPQLDNVKTNEIASATETLSPYTPAGQISRFKSCSEPLASITLTAAAGSVGIIRIKSGTYETPNIRLSNVPTRIALPYPAPYNAGKGVLSFEAYEPEDFYASLTPTQHLQASNVTTTTVDTWWSVLRPCA